MLPLNDPLWQKLDDAHGDRDIPDVLSRLAELWSDDAANSLLWDCLCHQDTCYGATYAAIPHLLNMAQSEENRHQRLEVALFAGHVALCARQSHEDAKGWVESPHLEGLPGTLDAWERKRDIYRGIVASLENPRRSSSHFEQSELLPRYRKILAVAPVDHHDLEKIRSIGAEFIAALPPIRALCERALLENLQDRNAAVYLLSGIAACDGLLDLARLLEHGVDGECRCSSCDRRYHYLLFGDRIALYADESRAYRDFKEHAPSRADGFVAPIRDGDVIDRRATTLLFLAQRAANPKPAVLLRNFLGSFRCGRCGAQNSVRAA